MKKFFVLFFSVILFSLSAAYAEQVVKFDIKDVNKYVNENSNFYKRNLAESSENQEPLRLVVTNWPYYSVNGKDKRNVKNRPSVSTFTENLNALINLKTDRYIILDLSRFQYSLPVNFPEDSPFREVYVNNQLVINFENNRNIKKVEGSFKIGENCFKNAVNLEEITSDCTEIEAYAFQNCTALTKVNLGCYEPFVNEHAFEGCNNLSELNFISDKNSTDFYEFVYNGFQGSSSVSKVIQECKTNGIFSYEYHHKNLVEVTLPPRITEINNRAFEGCTELTKVTINSPNVGIGFKSFYGCTNLKEINITGPISGELAFANCSSLEEITIPEEVNEIGCKAFSNCRNLKKVTFENSSIKIDDSAFQDCIHLKEITISNSVGKYAFSGCSDLETVNFPADLQEIKEGTFKDCTSLKEIVLPSSVNKIGSNSFSNCSELQSVTFNEGLKEIEEEAFKACTKLEKVKLPSSLENLGYEAFMGCTSLTEAELQNPQTYLHYGTFAKCSNLRTVILPYGIKVIPGYFLLYCGITEINLPESVEEIQECAFSCCNSLSSIKVPSATKKIGCNAFYRCSNLEYVEIDAGISEIEECTFFCCPKLKEVKLPETIETISSSSFEGCLNLTKVNIPDSVKRIESKAFFYTNVVPNGVLELPPNLEFLGDYAFSGDSIKTLIIPASIKIIDFEALRDMRGLENIIFKGTIAQISKIDAHYLYHFHLDYIKCSDGKLNIKDYCDSWRDDY